MSQITTFNPLTGLSSTAESNDAEQAHGVDASGASLGLVALGSAFAQVPEPPPGPGWLWHFAAQQWRFTPTLEAAVLDACSAIDSCAGAARLRYITDVPGQQATYMAKADEAAAFLAGAATPGPYLQAEAEATGQTPMATAQQIMGLQNYWGAYIGPAIEKARRMGKITAAAAATLEEVESARLAAFNTLGGI
jgi:hypothetical protein